MSENRVTLPFGGCTESLRYGGSQAMHCPREGTGTPHLAQSWETLGLLESRDSLHLAGGKVETLRIGGSRETIDLGGLWELSLIHI